MVLVYKELLLMGGENTTSQKITVLSAVLADYRGSVREVERELLIVYV